jgi:hypothetical protein
MRQELETSAAPLVLITSPNPWKLQKLVAREKARRALVVQSSQTMVRPGLWGVYVYQVKPFRPAWLVPSVVAGGALAAAGCLWLLLQALVGILVSLGLATVLGALVVGLAIVRLARPGVTVDVHTRVRVR